MKRNILKGIFALSVFGVLFLTSCGKNKEPHTHQYNDGEVTLAPTCTDKGVKTFKCTGCEESYTEEIPALGHEVVNDAAVAATCTTEGKTAGTHCSRCEAILTAQTVLPALGHTEVVDIAVPATCTQTGLTEGSHCSVCNAIIVAQEEVQKLAHTAVLVPGTPATCTTDGTKDCYQCSVCSGFFEDEACTVTIENLQTWVADYEGGKIKAHHTPVLVPGTPATEFDAGILDSYKCSECEKIFLDEACTQEVIEGNQLVDPIKSINVSEVWGIEPETSVVVRGVVLGAMSNNDYPELLIKDLVTNQIIGVSGFDNDITTSSTNYLGKFTQGQVIAVKGTTKFDTAKIGGQYKKIRLANGKDDIVVSDKTAEYKFARPENIPVARTTQELDQILMGDSTQYSYVKLVGPIYGYFTGQTVRFWLGENNNKDALCTAEDGGSCLTCYGVSPDDATTKTRVRPLINFDAVNTNLGKTLASLLGIEDTSKYSGYTKYFTFEGEMYVMCVGGNVWSAQFLPLFEEDIIAHDTCAKFAFAHEPVELTQTTHGSIAYYECAYCGKLYAEAECTNEITLEDTVVHNYVHHEAMAADCENTGMKEYYTCTLCDLKFFKEGEKYVKTEDTMVVAALGHDYGNLIEEVLPTVEANGLKAHYVCSRCTKLFDIEYKETTIQELTIEKLTHIHEFTQSIAGLAATCNTNGWLACYQCTYPDCGAIAAELNGSQVASSLDAWKAGEGLLPHHDFRHIEAVPVTCHSDGSVEYWYCADCNIYYKTIDADPLQVYTSIEETVIAQGHTYGDNVAVNIVRDQNGTSRTLLLCTRCNHYVDQDTAEEFEGTITYQYLRATVGYTFKDGDKIIMGNGQGGSGPGTKLAYSYYEGSDKYGSGSESFSSSYNDADEVKKYNANCVFTLIQGTDENAAYFRIANKDGHEIAAANDATTTLGYGNNAGAGDYWSLNVENSGKGNNCIIYAPLVEKAANKLVAFYSDTYGYRIGRRTSYANTLAVYVYTATLVAIVA